MPRAYERASLPAVINQTFLFDCRERRPRRSCKSPCDLLKLKTLPLAVNRRPLLSEVPLSQGGKRVSAGGSCTVLSYLTAPCQKTRCRNPPTPSASTPLGKGVCKLRAWEKASLSAPRLPCVRVSCAVNDRSVICIPPPLFSRRFPSRTRGCRLRRCAIFRADARRR